MVTKVNGKTSPARSGHLPARGLAPSRAPPRLAAGFGSPQGFPGGSAGKESAYSAGDLGLIPGLGRFPGKGNGYPLPYSCLGNPMDRGAWWATVSGVTKSKT